MAYPIPTFHFEVDWGGTNGSFTEVSGLNRKHEKLTYRGGASKETNEISMPGRLSFDDITLKRGVFQGDNEFYDWLLTTNTWDKVNRRDITIKLLNSDHQPVVTWSVKAAWPLSMEGPSLNSTGNEIAFESLTLSHEGITVQNDG